MLNHGDSGHWVVDEGELRFAPGTQLSAAESWLVTLASPLSVMHGDFLDSVLPGQRLDVLCRRLQQVNGIHDRESFERTVQWFVREGNRRSYRVLWRLVLRANPVTHEVPSLTRVMLRQRLPTILRGRRYRQADYDLVARRIGMPAREVREKLDAANGWLPLLQHHLGIDPKAVQDLVAWDAARLVTLTRWAIGAGFIGRDEFVTYAGALGRRVQEAYRNWNAFGAAYAVGGLMCKAGPARQVQVIGSVGVLTTHARSPFRGVSLQAPAPRKAGPA